MKFKKIFTILALLSIYIFPSVAYGFILIERTELSFDDGLAVKDSEVYALPEKIIISTVSGSADELTINSEDWVSVLYYYYITRLKFADIPYNYIIDRDGNICKGRTGWDGVMPELLEPEGVILIGYLSQTSDITLPASSAFKDLIEDISYDYGITKDKVKTVDLYLAETKEDELGKLVYKESTGLFTNNINKMLSSLTFSKTQHLSINADVADIDYENKVDANAVFEVSIKVKNNGEIPWFTFNDYIYVVTADLKDSPFAINGEWDSFDTPAHIEGETIFPEESKEIVMKMKAPLLPGKYTEEFGIKRISDNKIISGTKFDVIIEVNAGDMKLVKVLETGTGSLNVRETPSYSGKILAQAAVDKVLVMVEKSGGWYKVKYDGDKTGWVYGQYIKEL